MKKIICMLLAVMLLPVSACAQPVEPDLSAYDTSGKAEIPMEILGGLDQATREDLLEEPKYVALTFDDGPRADTTGRLLDGLLERGRRPLSLSSGSRCRAMRTCSGGCGRRDTRSATTPIPTSGC